MKNLTNIFAKLIQPEKRRYKANDYVFRQDTPVEGIFVVEEGQVRLERYSCNGNAIKIHHSSANESFAEAALFSDSYNCYAVATKPSVLILYSKDEILRVLRERPETAIEYIAMLSDHVKTLRSNLELRGIQSARERILGYFLQIVDRDTHSVTLPFTLKDLSSQLGLAHETVYRELRKLEQESIIERSGNIIKIVGAV